MARRPGSRSWRDCEACGETYRAKMSGQRACSRECGVAIRHRAGNFRGRQPYLNRCAVPSEHPARWYGTSSEVTYGTCEWCARLVVQRRSWRTPRLYCSDPCDAKAKKERRRSRAVATPEWQTWTWSGFMTLAQRFDFTCAYCGTTPVRLDPDHVVPLSRGGANTLSNLLPACMPCNSDKRDLTFAEWATDRTRRGLPPVRTQWADDDSRYWHLTTLAAA